jgi:hypothetical protein
MARRLIGKTAPRLFTPPRRTLTRRTSLGFEVCDFAAAIGESLFPWQKWFFVHAMELNPDRTLRFSTILLEVSRQSGKTTAARIMTLHRMYVMAARLVLGVAADVSLARENWRGAVDTINASPWLRADLAGVRYANGDETLTLAPLEYDDTDGDESATLATGSRYKICAPNRRAGRGLSCDFIHWDEVRELRTWDSWSALQPTTAARPNAQILLTTNAGDSQSVVLNGLRESALSGRSADIGLFSWSAEPGADPLDVRQWRQANPGLGFSISERAIRAAYDTMPIARFRTEYLCQYVDQLDGAIDLQAWRDCADPAAGAMTALRGRGIAACFDASPDGEHATLAVAVRLPDGRARVELAGVWTTQQAARAELGPLLDRIRPQVTAWYAGGAPAGAYASILRARPGSAEITGARVSEACMELASLVTARRIVHGGEEILDAHVSGATRLATSDGWRFGRKGHEPCDAAYAAAGAISAVLALPEPKRARIRVLA